MVVENSVKILPQSEAVRERKAELEELRRRSLATGHATRLRDAEAPIQMRLNNFTEQRRQSLRNEKVQLQEAKTYMNNYRANDQAVMEDLQLKKETAKRDRRSIQNAKELLHLYKAEDSSVLTEFKNHHYNNSPQNNNNHKQLSNSSSSSNSSLPCSYARSNMTITTKNDDNSENDNNENNDANEEQVLLLSSLKNGGQSSQQRGQKNIIEPSERRPFSFSWKDLKEGDGEGDGDGDGDGDDSERMDLYCVLKPSMTTETETSDWTTESPTSVIIRQHEIPFGDDGDRYGIEYSTNNITSKIVNAGEVNSENNNNNNRMAQQEVIQSKGVQKEGDTISDIYIPIQSDRERADSDRHFTASLRGLQSSANFDEKTNDREGGSSRSISTNKGVQKVVETISDIYIPIQRESIHLDSNQHFTASLRGLQSSADFDEEPNDRADMHIRTSNGVQKEGGIVSNIRGQGKGKSESERCDSNRHFTTSLCGLQSSANFDETNSEEDNSRSISTTNNNKDDNDNDNDNPGNDNRMNPAVVNVIDRTAMDVEGGNNSSSISSMTKEVIQRRGVRRDDGSISVIYVPIQDQSESKHIDSNQHFAATLRGLQSSSNFDETNNNEEDNSRLISTNDRIDNANDDVIQSKVLQKEGDIISGIRGQSERDDSNKYFTATLHGLQSSANFDETSNREDTRISRPPSTNDEIDDNNNDNDNDDDDDDDPGNKDINDPYYDDNIVSNDQKKVNECSLIGKRVREKECFACSVM